MVDSGSSQTSSAGTSYPASAAPRGIPWSGSGNSTEGTILAALLSLLSFHVESCKLWAEREIGADAPCERLAISRRQRVDVLVRATLLVIRRGPVNVLFFQDVSKLARLLAEGSREDYRERAGRASLLSAGSLFDPFPP